MFEEQPTSDLDSPEKVAMWTKTKQQTMEFCTLLAQQGNRFYLGHKYDKRGRVYAQGFHISTQGNPYRKAMLDFADKHPVTDIPEEFAL